MPKSNSSKTEQEESLEKKLWKTADKLRKNMDAAEYKHVVLGLIFLKYISDAFEEQYQKLVEQKSEGADPEDKNEYTAEKVFYVPPSSRWKRIRAEICGFITNCLKKLFCLLPQHLKSGWLQNYKPAEMQNYYPKNNSLIMKKILS